MARHPKLNAWQYRKSPGPRYRDQPWNARNRQFMFGAMTVVEKQRLIIGMMEQTGGCLRQAARLMGVSKQLLQDKVRRFGLRDEVARIRRESKARFSLIDWPDEREEVA